MSELFPAQAKAPAAVLAGAAVDKDAPPRRGGPRHLLRASGAANPSRSAGGAAFRAPGTSRPLTTPGAPPHPADGGGKPGRASVRADGELRVDGISFTDPEWTVFHLPSTLGHMDRRIENVRRDPIPRGKRQRRVGRCAAKSARPSLAEAQKLRPVTVIHLAAAAAGSSVFAASARPPGGAVPVVSRSSKRSNIEVRRCSDGWEEGHGFHPTTSGGVNSASRPRRQAVDLATGTELSFSFLSDDSNPKRLSLQIVCACLLRVPNEEHTRKVLDKPSM